MFWVTFLNKDLHFKTFGNMSGFSFVDMLSISTSAVESAKQCTPEVNNNNQLAFNTYYQQVQHQHLNEASQNNVPNTLHVKHTKT